MPGIRNPHKAVPPLRTICYHALFGLFLSFDAFPMTPNAETVHQYFRGANEAAKHLRTGAFVGDLSAAVLACLGVWGYLETKSGWLPFITLLIATIGVVVRAIRGA